MTDKDITTREVREAADEHLKAVKKGAVGAALDVFRSNQPGGSKNKAMNQLTDVAQEADATRNRINALLDKFDELEEQEKKKEQDEKNG